MRIIWLTICLMSTSIITLSAAIRCMGSAQYRLTFHGEWTKTSHPEDFPLASGPHFSPVVGCSHKASYVMWRVGILATAGVKEVAEEGTTAGINKEMDEQILLKTALVKFQGRRIHSTGSSVVNDVQLNSDYPLVSAITMIAPSPDWIIGVHDYSLCDETTGKWIDKRVEDLFPYDAGTDSGPRFVHNGTPTIPQEPISLITNTQDGSFKSNNPIKRLGTFTFVKTSESNPELSSITKKNQKPNTTLTPFSSMTIVPNPTISKVKSNKMMSPNHTLEGNLKPTTSNATFSAMPSSASVKTTMKPSSNATRSKASLLSYLCIFVSSKLMIFNLFFH